MKRMIKEIGSEYHQLMMQSSENLHLDLTSGEKRYILSGRTALAHIADDLRNRGKFSCVALPDYCCGSMVSPFHRKGIEVIFYHSMDGKSEAIIKRADAVLVMDYFGFFNPQTERFAQLCKDMGKTLIVDATQTAFSRLPTYQLADYLVVSHRKWMDSLSASVYCRNGFSVSNCQKSSEKYTNIWRQAAQEKAEYLRTGTGCKQHFLDLYGEANHLLANDYENMAAAPEEIMAFEQLDSHWLREKRRENAAVLLEGLREEACPTMRTLFSEMGVEDCPLFVPVLLDERIRAEVRKELIGQQIYCPVHWPVDQQLPHEETELCRTELSLICDQRYGIEDMQRQIEALVIAVKRSSHGLQ